MIRNFLVDSLRGTPPRYCSEKCTTEGARKSRTAYKNISRICPQCNKEFFVNKWKATTQKFCSQRCNGAFNSKYGGTRVDIPCDVCGKIMSRTLHDVHDSNYCGYECMAKGKALDVPGTNGFANVRRWFGRLNRMSKCEACGYDEIPGISFCITGTVTEKIVI